MVLRRYLLSHNEVWYCSLGEDGSLGGEEGGL